MQVIPSFTYKLCHGVYAGPVFTVFDFILNT
jgi:hypothetical protein